MNNHTGKGFSVHEVKHFLFQLFLHHFLSSVTMGTVRMFISCYLCVFMTSSKGGLVGFTSGDPCLIDRTCERWPHSVTGGPVNDSHLDENFGAKFKSRSLRPEVVAAAAAAKTFFYFRNSSFSLPFVFCSCVGKILEAAEAVKQIRTRLEQKQTRFGEIKTSTLIRSVPEQRFGFIRMKKD